MNRLLLRSIVVNLYFCLFTVHGHLKMATCFASLSSDNDLEFELIE